MKFDLLENFIKPVEYKPLPEPEPLPLPEPEPLPQVQTDDARKVNAQFVGANNRLQLEKKLPAGKPTAYGALEAIENLPKPDPSNPAAVRAYKQKAAALADNAIKNSQPPTFEQFLNYGLNGATASMEYEQASTTYNSQITQLKNIVADARNYPGKILTPGEAVIEINNLPRPDRNNPQSILDYNNKRAEIAASGLLYATPPNREDYLNSGLNGRTANYEYEEALASYSTSVRELNDFVIAKGTTTPPKLTDEEIEQAAQNLINQHGGAGNEDEAYAIGKDLSALSDVRPEDAILIMNKVQEKLNGTTFGDNVASGFVDNASTEELRNLSRTSEGKAMLENLITRLTTGDVHRNEWAQAAKITEAITGFNPNSLTGRPEDDAKTVDEQLKNLPADMRDDYVKELLNHPYGQNAIRFAAVMSPEGSEMLGKALGELYSQNPSETADLLKQITNAENIGYYPYYYESGLARAIAKSGNDDLILSFAQNEIDRAKNDPDEVRGYLNAVSVYAGLSPEGLQRVMETNPDFYKTIEEAGKLTSGPASSGGFENGNIWETGLGDLLEKASQIKGADGKATPESIKLFETLVDYAGSNFRTMEGLGAFFIEHAEQLVDKYTNPLDPNTPGSEVLEKFFGNVVYSRIGDLLQYKDGKLVDAIMGDANGNGGVIGDIIDKYLSAANARPGDREQDGLLGQRIGFLWSALSKGFLRGVQNYKDDWMDDKKLRDFTFDMLGRGLGQIASKFGLPGEVIDTPLGLVQGIYDARAEEDKEKQLEMFKTAFSELNNSMFTRLNNYDTQNENVEGVHNGFVNAYNWQMVQNLLNDVITE